MKINTPWHAAPQLDQVAGQFEHWRRTRIHPRDRLPQALWDQAVALASVRPSSRVAQHWRWSAHDLKKQMARPPQETTAMPPLPLGFVEVPSAPAWPQTSGATQVEGHRVDGTRLCLHAATSTLPLAALVRALLEGRSCCSFPPTAASVWPPNRWIAAQASMDSGPCAGTSWERTPWRGPSTSSVTVRARRSSWCSTMGTAPGCG